MRSRRRRRRLRGLLTGLVATALALVALGAGVVAGLPGDAPDTIGAPPSPGAVVQDPDGVVVPSPSPPPPPPAPPPPPFTDDELVADLTRLVDAAKAKLDDGELAVAITTAERSVVVTEQAERPMLPASTAKLVTAASALATVGHDHRFVTEARSTAEIHDGVLDGDLVLVGVGDPVLATPGYGRFAYPARPRTRLEDLADALVDAGLERVTGDILGAAAGFPADPLADGWQDSYLSSYNARYITGLTVDAGLIVRGAGPDATQADIQLDLATNPVRRAAVELRQLLVERDVVVAGEAHSRRSGGDGATLAEVSSPPLSELLRFMVQRSDNHLADTLFKVVGHAATGTGTWESGETAAAAAMLSLGVTADGLRLEDGSGLSRRDRLSARLLAELDAVMTDGPDAAVWSELMAVMGVEGTLRHRLRGTVAEGRFLGKTGTLSDVISLAGSVITPTGEPAFHLAVMGNDTRGAERGVVRALMDRVVLTLVAALDGCEIATPAPAPRPSTTASASPTATPTLGPLGLPPAEVRCPQPS